MRAALFCRRCKLLLQPIDSPSVLPCYRDPSALRQESRPQVRSLPISEHAQSTRSVFFQPIRFVIFDNESVNRGLSVLEADRGLDSWHRPEGSRWDQEYDIDGGGGGGGWG